MALITPKINSATDLLQYVWIQRGYQYGINDSGPFQRFSIRGRNADIENYANLLALAGWTITITREAVDDATGPNDSGFSSVGAAYGFSLLEAQCGWQFPQIYGTETPEDIWELEAQDDPTTLTSADMPYAQVPGLSSAYDVYSTKQAIVAMLDSNIDYVWNDNTLTAAPPNPQNNPLYNFNDGLNAVDGNGALTNPLSINLPSADYQTAKQFYSLMKNGFENYPVTAPTIRHSVVTSNVYTVKASYINALRIISPPSMYSIEGVPTNIFYTVPTTPAAVQFIIAPGDLQYGYRKTYPNITRLNRWKWRIQQNYIYGLWPVEIFGNML